MQNIGDIEYVTPIRIGQQTVTGIMDTGSYELVVFSTKCTTCGQAAKYNPNVSPTHKTEMLMTTMTYGSGDTYSWEASDEVSIGPFPERNQSFWEVVEARMPILRNAAFQAIIGLGPPETPAADAWTEVHRTLDNVNRFFNEGRIPPDDVTQNSKETIDAAVELSKTPAMLDNFAVKTFSVCMSPQPGADGYFIWSDSSAFTEPDLFTRIPVVGRHTWTVSLSNVRMTKPGTFTETQLGCSGNMGCNALVDTGTSLLAVPHAVVHQVQEMVAKLNTDCTDLRDLPNLVFELGGNLFSLPPDAYVASVEGTVPSYLQNVLHVGNVSLSPRKSSRECKVLLMESYMDSPEGPLWILGMPFFRKYYTSFHVGDDRSKRSLFVAEANDECNPTARTSLARTRPYTRRIDISKALVPPVFKQAISYKKISKRLIL